MISFDLTWLRHDTTPVGVKDLKEDVLSLARVVTFALQFLVAPVSTRADLVLVRASYVLIQRLIVPVI